MNITTYRCTIPVETVLRAYADYERGVFIIDFKDTDQVKAFIAEAQRTLEFIENCERFEALKADCAPTEPEPTQSGDTHGVSRGEHTSAKSR